MTETAAAFDLGALNSATKYPSIMTYHELDPKTGKLLEGTALPFGDSPVILTEKVDGTNGRVVVTPDGDWFIGSREELLYAAGDRIENPALGIVPALLPLAPTLARTAAVTVYFLEVYGHKIGGAAKQYTSSGGTGFRLFDVAEVPPQTLDLPREQISSWREHGGQHFQAEWELELYAEHGGLPRVPRLGTVAGGELPRTLEGMQEFLAERAPASKVALDEGAGGRAEGIVLRTPDRGLIVKARFQDYDRTLRKQPQRAGVR